MTFAPRDEVIDYLTENVSEAALAVYRQRSDEEIARLLLDHVNQRFRFSYVLGRGPTAIEDDSADDDLVTDDDEGDEDDLDPNEYGNVDLAATAQVVADAVDRVKAVVARHADDVIENLADVEEDERVLAEFIEENLDADLRQSDEFHQIVDSLVDEIEKRFVALEVGDLKESDRAGRAVVLGVR